MKKVIVWALTVCIMISLAGCSSSQGTPGQNQPGTQDQNQSENNSQNTGSKMPMQTLFLAACMGAETASPLKYS